MHRSRLVAIGIDCQGEDLDGAALFWSAALGREPEPVRGHYVHLPGPPGTLHAFVQRVDHPSRIHIDIETDDLEAEVARLEALGARRVHQVKDWWVMEAPTGHRFCVDTAREPLPPDATEWP